MKAMIDAMRSHVELRYNDSNKTDRITDSLESFTFTDYANGSADSITMALNNRNMEWMKGYFPKENDWIKCWIKTANWPISPSNGKLYCGWFSIDHLQFTGFGHRVNIEASSIPRVVDFSVTQKDKTWEKTTVKTILEKIAGDAKVKLLWDAKDKKVESISQSGNTDMQFAFSLCTEYGICLKVYNKTLIAYDQDKYEKKAPAFTLKPADLGEYNIDVELTSRYNSVSYQYSSDSNDKALTYNFTIPGREKEEKRVLFVNEKADSVEEAEIKAKAKLREAIRQEYTISLSGLMGHERYLAATTFKLEGFGDKINGVYFIDQATHTNGASAYKCDIAAHKVVTLF